MGMGGVSGDLSINSVSMGSISGSSNNSGSIAVLSSQPISFIFNSYNSMSSYFFSVYIV